jgi:hypothetical protein
MKRTAFFLLVELIMLFVMSCSPFISIPRENYTDLDGTSEVVFILTSGEKITASNYWTSGDTLFISEPGQLIYKGRQDTVLLDEIVEIRDYKNARLHPAAQAAVNIAGIMLGLLVGFSLYIAYLVVTDRIE